MEPSAQITHKYSQTLPCSGGKAQRQLTTINRSNNQSNLGKILNPRSHAIITELVKHRDRGIEHSSPSWRIPQTTPRVTSRTGLTKLSHFSPRRDRSLATNRTRPANPSRQRLRPSSQCQLHLPYLPTPRSLSTPQSRRFSRLGHRRPHPLTPNISSSPQSERRATSPPS